ncbi:sigma-70 family RNA polymerase sigma factor [Desulfonatronum parangueonense]
MAVTHGAKDAVLLQLQRGTDVNAVDDIGRSALTLAVEKGHGEICRILLEFGANPALCDVRGNDPLSIAIKHGLADVETLLRQYLNPPSTGSPLVTPTSANAPPSHPDTSSSFENAPIYGGEERLFDDAFDPSCWEEETEAPRPEGDKTCVTDARRLQEQISSHQPVDADEDWSDVDIDLPELLEFSRGRRRRWEEDTDWLNAARRLFLAGIRNGWVREDELVRSVPADEEDRDVPDQEYLSSVRVVLGDMDVLVLDAPEAFVPASLEPETMSDELADPEDPLEAVADEALAFLSSLLSTTNDPLTWYARDIGAAKPLSREEEIDLAFEISAGTREALGSIPRSSVAMEELLDGLKNVEQELVPIKSIICSKDNTDEDAIGEESLNLVKDDECDDEDVHVIEAGSSAEAKSVSGIPSDLRDKFDSIRALHREMARAQSITERESLAARLRDEIHGLGISSNFMEHLWGMVESDEASRQAREILARGLKRARTAKNMFALANLKLVMWVARKYGGMTYIDRIQEGNIGLLKAIDRFDPSYGARFSTYAVWWIRQSILRAVADQDRLIRLPVHTVEAKRKIQSASNSLTGRLQRDPTPEELALEAGIQEHIVCRIQEIPEDPISMPSAGELESSIAAVIADSAMTNPEDLAMHASLKEALDESLQCLTEKEADVMRLRFGLAGDKDHTLEQIGQVYGVTRERIRQIEAKAFRKLAHRARINKLKLFLQ